MRKLTAVAALLIVAAVAMPSAQQPTIEGEFKCEDTTLAWTPCDGTESCYETSYMGATGRVWIRTDSPEEPYWYGTPSRFWWSSSPDEALKGLCRHLIAVSEIGPLDPKTDDEELRKAIGLP